MMNKKTGITTGDLFGIGEEITRKAIQNLNLNKNEFVVIGKKIEGCECITVNDKDNGDFCFNSLKIACEMAQKGEISAIVTSPVSKEVLNKSGYKFSGQTEILEHFLGNEHEKADMLFIAGDLRVMLLTRHLALKDIKITKEMIIEHATRLNNFLVEKCGIKSPSIGMCALNPHAGENGLLGNEEIEIITPACEILQKNGINISKPLVADALFAHSGQKYLRHEKQDYDAVIACYHDQGLTAVKALAFNEVVNTTIGLKVIRTSPSHGTAYDIAGKNIANPKSMEEAIKLAKLLA